MICLYLLGAACYLAMGAIVAGLIARKYGHHDGASCIAFIWPLVGFFILGMWTCDVVDGPFAWLYRWAMGRQQ